MTSSFGPSPPGSGAARVSADPDRVGRASPKKRLFARGWVFAALGAVTILVLTVAGSILLALRTGDALDLASRTQQTRAALSAVLEAVQDAETGQRGYLLTGKETYLAPYEAALRALPGTFDWLQALVADRPDIAAAVAPVREIAQAKLAELARTVALQRSGDHSAANALVQTDSGDGDMTRLRAMTARLLAAQAGVIDRETERVARGRRMLLIMDLVGLALILVLVMTGLAAIRRAIAALEASAAELSAANAELARSNDTLEEKVDQRTAALTTANEEIQRFAYIVSHDLRAPLVNIMGFTSELDMVGTSLGRFVTVAEAHAPAAAVADVRVAVFEDLPEAIRFIKTSASKMDRLIGAILQLSREGRRVLKPEHVPMRELLTGIVESMAIQLSECGATVEMAAIPDIVGDRLALEQVFSNLLENAVKYLKPGRAGRIVVRGHKVGGEAVFEVQDNGRGIAARDHERIFELFRRAGDQTVPGEGIGLAHVRALVRRLGGKIDCLSALDVGSTFRVQFPLVLVQGGARE